MSTLNVSNITDGTNSVETVYVARGSAKAWVNFNGTGTIATRDSFNVSSLTDNGTGDYTVNLTSGMGSVNFCASHSTGDLIAGLHRDRHLGENAGARSTSSFRAISNSSQGSANGYAEDMNTALSVVMGDLA